MSFSKKGRNFRTESRRTIPNSSANISELDNHKFAEAIAKTLHEAFGGTGRSIKTVMKYTGASERTVKNWFQGKNGPNGENLTRLIHHSDEVLVALLKMAGREDVLAGKLLINARDKLVEILEIIDRLSFDESLPGQLQRTPRS